MQSILQYCVAIGASERHFEPGAVLLDEGITSGLLYVLIEGTIEVARGETTIIMSSEPGAVYGEMSALLGKPHTATVKAVTAVRAHRLENADGVLQSDPAMAYGVAKILAQRLQAATTYLVDIKRQFQDHTNHFGMVDEVLESLVNQQGAFSPGSDRQPEGPE